MGKLMLAVIMFVGRLGPLTLGSAIAIHIWKWLPFWTLILLAGGDSGQNRVFGRAKPPPTPMAVWSST